MDIQSLIPTATTNINLNLLCSLINIKKIFLSAVEWIRGWRTGHSSICSRSPNGNIIHSGVSCCFMWFQWEYNQKCSKWTANRRYFLWSMQVCNRMMQIYLFRWNNDRLLACNLHRKLIISAHLIFCFIAAASLSSKMVTFQYEKLESTQWLRCQLRYYPVYYQRLEKISKAIKYQNLYRCQIFFKSWEMSSKAMFLPLCASLCLFDDLSGAKRGEMKGEEGKASWSLQNCVQLAFSCFSIQGHAGSNAVPKFWSECEWWGQQSEWFAWKSVSHRRWFSYDWLNSWKWS
jgi:hypothetical protein